MDGGIFGFLGLVAAHRGALEHDWRTRFGVSLMSVGQTMTLSEAARQVRALALDPSTHTFAAVNGWSYPVGRDALALLDLFDAYAMVHFKKPKPLPRPWDLRREVLGRKTSLTQDEVIAALRAAGHTAPLPSAV